MRASLKYSYTVSNLKTLALIASVFFISSCSKYEKINVANTYSRMDVAATEATFSALNSSLMETEGSFLNATCNTSVTFRTCAYYTGTDYRATYNWDTCGFDNSKISVSGVWRSYYYNDSSMVCAQPIPTGKETSRLTRDNDIVTYRMSNGDTLEISTRVNTGFPGQALNGYGIKTLQVNPTSRALRIDNMQVTRKNSGVILYDTYLFSSDVVGTTQLTVTGKLNTSNRVLNGFTYAFFKEQARVKATFSAVTWSDATCCFPKSGSINLAFDSFNPNAPASWPTTGKTSSVAFTSTCGEALITGQDGLTSQYTFSECF
ncbi:MAG: hypothetical protein H7Z71_03715 [Moraxellaceae bacterium]|nr:hypothetical protein [Pseudobdellovibrionaceae bacterium]